MRERHSQLTVGDASIHVVEAGPAGAPSFVLLHGWPESWPAWRPVMARAEPDAHVVAVDLPGVGESSGSTGGTKRDLARTVHELVITLGLEDVTLVGHDVGGMIAYTYWRMFGDLGRAVIMDVAVPGVDPWAEVERNPRIWHFGLHQVPGLPEELVRGRQRAYFDFFYDALAADPARIEPETRRAYAAAYASDAALTAGFDWYRAFPDDAKDNADTTEVRTPLLYLRGDHEPGDLDAYAAGLREAGASTLECALIPGAGHFAPEEAPDAVWSTVSRYAGRTRRSS
ncbi:pimeloyl-ACP methyl ester carboxylesterase [Hamadaea flava]|uniref:Alpha/beta fold hydrolase n=1 Tax=Hamadaea flava TaxID=1742688 RepID=A0ABV8LH42_9ACTN|nr:alpha/beta hydrolase [Hamadaea flava]MCP2324325.1 pimeloyl-ACP methyl ester carboxylesterase [Hamadaea flava]